MKCTWSIWSFLQGYLLQAWLTIRNLILYYMCTYERNQHDLERNTQNGCRNWLQSDRKDNPSWTLCTAFTTRDGIGQTVWPDAGGRRGRNRCQTRIKPSAPPSLESTSALEMKWVFCSVCQVPYGEIRGLPDWLYIITTPPDVMQEAKCSI